MESMNNDSQNNEQLVDIALKGEMNISYVNHVYSNQSEMSTPRDIMVY